MTVWTWLWIGWLALFGVIESVAAFNAKGGDTLSEQVWRWLTQPRHMREGKDPAPWVWAGRAGVTGLLIWMLLHFVFGI